MELKVKKTENPSASKTQVTAKVRGYCRFKNARMAIITGNFMNGEFRISQNKLKAILNNLDELKRFADGAYDIKVDELDNDSILEFT